MNPVWHFLNGVPYIGPLSIQQTTITLTGPALAADGSESAPSWSFSGDPNTGWFRAGDATTGAVLRGAVNGNTRFTLDASGGVYLPVNTASLNFGASNDVQLSWGATNVLLLAAGDSLAFGVATASGPALARTLTALSVQLADGSAAATLHGKLRDSRTETPEATDGNVTYSTAQVLGGIITRSNMGANRVDAFPTAANLVAAIPGCVVGTSFDVIVNNNDTAQTVTVNGASNGITYEGAATAIAATECRLFRVLITNVTGASEAATVFQVV